MELGKSKVVIKPSCNGKYKTTWIYIPSKLAKDSAFPFEKDDEILIEVQNDSLLITRNNKRSRIIKEFGIDNATLPKLLEKKANENRNHNFLYFEDKIFTINEINEKTNQIAWGIINQIRNFNIKNPKIALMLNNCPDFIFSWFAIIKSGCVFVPINTRLKREYLKHILNDSDSNFIIIDYEFFETFKKIEENLPKIKKVYIYKAPDNFGFNEKYYDYNLLINSKSENPNLKFYDEDPVEILYTEGVTGKPKGVLYRNLVKSSINIGFELNKIGLKEDTKIYCPMPLFHGASQFYVIIPSIFYDASVILAKNFNSLDFWEDIRKYRPTGFSYFGGYLLNLLTTTPTKHDRNHSIKWAFGFGAGIKHWKAFEQRFGIILYEGWSHMEGVGVTINTLGSKGGKMSSIGKALDFVELKIVDSQGRDLPTGSDNVGEIVVKSKINYILEYYKEPENSDVRIGDNGWVFTGDYGYMDDDGYVYFMGKKNEIIYKAGEMIFLKEIERTANSHANILYTACVPIQNESKSRFELILYAVKKRNSHMTPRDLSNFLFHNMAYYHVPRYFQFRDDIPSGPSTEFLKAELNREWRIKNKSKNKIWDNQIQDYIKN